MTLIITLDKLVAISGRRKPTDVMAALVDPLQKHLGAAGILDSRLQTIHFLAQGCHETDRFNTLVEYGKRPYFDRYDTRTDLGNTPQMDGDGYRYRGRGFFQLTGANNYDRAGRDLGLPLLENPDVAADPETSVRIAVFYWQHRNIGAWAESDNCRAVTRLINGGLNGLPDREEALKRAKAAYKPPPDWIDNPSIPARPSSRAFS
ncbi:glycoside hydrolase family 19 protein [Inquilinus limosus]|uniref:glycoside hydrolase family 19 protein n=1 Tax=Inquilinus limosus TaxID=171674 RepID=UPI0006892C52|nr:glycoside hydrolase family 19 protein [Inquilinus limosus]